MIRNVLHHAQLTWGLGAEPRAWYKLYQLSHKPRLLVKIWFWMKEWFKMDCIHYISTRSWTSLWSKCLYFLSFLCVWDPSRWYTANLSDHKLNIYMFGLLGLNWKVHGVLAFVIELTAQLWVWQRENKVTQVPVLNPNVPQEALELWLLTHPIRVKMRKYFFAMKLICWNGRWQERERSGKQAPYLPTQSL